jgi:rhomboid protease GluP
MGPEEPVVLVKETWLSRKPAKGSGLVAAASLLVMAGFSLLFWSDSAGLASQLPANREMLLEQGQVWRLLTSVLVHADLQHLLANSVGIAVLGFLLYGYFGFRIHPLLTLVAGALVTFLSIITYPPQINLLGASGVVYLMAAFWLTMYVCIERRFSVSRRFLRAAGLVLIALIPTAYRPDTSYRTHVIGFSLGVIAALLYFFFNKKRFRRAEVIESDWE